MSGREIELHLDYHPPPVVQTVARAYSRHCNERRGRMQVEVPSPMRDDEITVTYCHVTVFRNIYTNGGKVRGSTRVATVSYISTALQCPGPTIAVRLSPIMVSNGYSSCPRLSQLSPFFLRMVTCFK